MSQNQAQNERE